MGAILRNVIVGNLLAVYGDLLTKRQQRLLDMHYNQDWSLGEIAQQEKISRQAVHDALVRGEKSLYEFEKTLHVLHFQQRIHDKVTDMMETIRKWHLTDDEKEEQRTILEEMAVWLDIESEEGAYGI